MLKAPFSLALGSLMLLTGLNVQAAEIPSATSKSPAMDSAFVIMMPGFANGLKDKTIQGQVRSIEEGLVIRQSKIEDGKIIIPPAGLYMTARTANWEPFNNEPMTMAGKKYYVITSIPEQSVIKNITMKKGDVVYTNAEKSRGWALTTYEPHSTDVPGMMTGTFKILKNTGNFYGTELPVNGGGKMNDFASDGTLVKADSGLPAGNHLPTMENGQYKHVMGNSVGSVGRSFVVVDEFLPDSIKIRELVTDNVVDLYLSGQSPEIKAYAKGDKFKLGNIEVVIKEVSDNAVTVEMIENGKAVTKQLGAMSDDDLMWYNIAAPIRDKMMMLSPSGKELVHLNIRGKDKVFAEGKVNLVAYADVHNVKQAPQMWAADPRFVTRPDS